MRQIRKIVGRSWATNDPAVLLTYADDPYPLAGMQMLRYIALPANTEEIVRIVQWANQTHMPYAVRGNGASVFGFVFSDGLILDFSRMKGIEIDRDNWIAAVEPGVTSFELQTAAAGLGLRANTAEPAATVCGNAVCTGTFSTWINAYGVAADNFVDLEMVDGQGRVVRLNQRQAPNNYAFENAARPAPGICTRAQVRLHPTTADEEGLLVPFSSFSEAVAFARELSIRRIGLAIGVLGGHYTAAFMSPSADLAEKVKTVFTESLEIKYLVFVVGDKYARQAIAEMASAIIDNRLFRILMLGLPGLVQGQWEDLVKGMAHVRFSCLCAAG